MSDHYDCEHGYGRFTPCPKCNPPKRKRPARAKPRKPRPLYFTGDPAPLAWVNDDGETATLNSLAVASEESAKSVRKMADWWARAAAWLEAQGK